MWMTGCRHVEMQKLRGRGRGKKSWRECVEGNMNKHNLRIETAQDRCDWRSGLKGIFLWKPSNLCRPRKNGR